MAKIRGINMFFYADLHVHSKYSRATSKSTNLEQLALWAQKKGINMLATGDFTHPAWIAEIKEKLVPVAPGAYELRDDLKKEFLINDSPLRFMLCVEISTIYKKGDKTRKVHHLVYAPDIEAAEKINAKLASIGNIVSDGRPILGLDSRNLLEIVLESSPDAYIIPAHIWTPWFSVMGSKSGFDTIDECYGDLAEHVFAAETGLSSDPPMNWRVSNLDRYRLVSNSDAHSPSKLGREATMFDTELDYYSVKNALQTGNGYVGTVEFFPEEGKYHMDGHRNCNICMEPEETVKHKGICPVCNKPVTVGVMHRVNALADRKEGEFQLPATAGQVRSLIPLQEILSEIYQVGVNSKTVTNAYETLIQKLGPELSILQDVPIDELSKADSPILAEAISKLREGNVIRNAGYDGEYGVIKVFEEGELDNKIQNSLFDVKKYKPRRKKQTKPKTESTTKTDIPKKKLNNHLKTRVEPIVDDASIAARLDKDQQEAVKNIDGTFLIVAGPGSGKTRVLTHRIAYMIEEQNIPANNCLAITFTHKAAKEMKDRLKALLPESFKDIKIHTFHSLCLSILKENINKAGLKEDFKIVNKQEQIALLMDVKDISENKANKLLNQISKAKRTQNTSDEDLQELLIIYQNKLKENNMVDFDDLISLTINLFTNDHDLFYQYQQEFKYISIDEYQDIDAQQYKLIKMLIPQNGNLCAIGDPNQAIYGFRGADITFFQNFKNDYPQAEIINLNRNYRSSNIIVEASSQLIDKDDIIAINQDSYDKITIHSTPTEKSEAEYTVKTIENLIGGHSFFSIDSNRSTGDGEDLSFCDFAILYRTSSQADALHEAFKRSGMPYVKYSNDLICDKNWVKQLIKELQEDNSSESLDIQVKNICSNMEEEREEHILQYLISLAQQNNDKEQFINNISLLTELDTLDERADRISLMTLHASKGLEFKVVFIVGLEDGIVPLRWGMGDDNTEEEKRLFYVGMTRAQNHLFLTRSQKRMWRGSVQEMSESPFLKYIEDELIKHSKFEKKQPQNKDKSQQLSLF